MSQARQRGVYEREPGMWYIRFADSTGRIRREKAGTYKMATDLYSKRKTEVLQGVKLPETLRKRAASFDELVEDALEHSKAHNSPQHYYSQTLRKPVLLEWFGGRQADSITTHEIERKLNQLAATMKPASVNWYRSLLSSVFSQGMRSGKVTSNPVSQVRQRRENNARVRFLDERDEAVLRDKIRKTYPDKEQVFNLALHTGMRKSEQFKLEWNTVDLERGVITIPKSKHGEKRHIPINSVARQALEKLLAEKDATGRVVPRRISPTKDHAPARASYDPQWFREVVRDTGVKDFHWHDLRHTFASRLVMAGVDLRTVQELMGHKTLNMTLRYAHLAPSHLQSAVERLAVQTDKVAVMRKTA